MTAAPPRADGLSGFAFAVPGGPSAGAAARRIILARDGTLDANVRERVLLLVTELVTNAVHHAKVGPRESVRVGFDQSRWGVRVEVVDLGPGFVRPLGHPPPRDGWGLYLVEQIADRWGVIPRTPGTCVWFEIDTTADRPQGVVTTSRQSCRRPPSP
jgi:anti-sigma regulatory factor (Ser/Thr protein kinase)